MIPGQVPVKARLSRVLAFDLVDLDRPGVIGDTRGFR
jgi:hypothetical protein